MSYMHAQGDLPIPGIVHIEQPYWYVNGGELSPEEYGLKAARALNQKSLNWAPKTSPPLLASRFRAPVGVIIRRPTY